MDYLDLKHWYFDKFGRYPEWGYAEEQSMTEKQRMASIRDAIDTDTPLPVVEYEDDRIY